MEAVYHPSPIIDSFLTLRNVYKSPPNESHLRIKLKLIACHILMKYRRRVYRKVFGKLKATTTNTEQDSYYIGAVTSYSRSGRNGIIRANNTDFVFSSDSINDDIYRHFVSKYTYVVFWGKQQRAFNISPVFNEKYAKLKHMTLYGFVIANGKRVKFSIYGNEHTMNIVRGEQFSIPTRTRVSFQIQMIHHKPYPSCLSPRI